jgi:hypothetical protein
MTTNPVPRLACLLLPRPPSEPDSSDQAFTLLATSMEQRHTQAPFCSYNSAGFDEETEMIHVE